MIAVPVLIVLSGSPLTYRMRLLPVEVMATCDHDPAEIFVDEVVT